MRFDRDQQRGRDGRRLDADVVEALRAVAGPPPATDIDWWTLRQTIVGDASAFLDGPRRGRRWWEYAAGWIRPAVPIGVAVSVVAVLAMGSASTAVSATTLSSVTVAADTTDGSVWLHAVRGGTAASTDVVDAAMASAQ